MNDPFVDTDIIIRLLTGDDPVKQAAASALFEKVQSGNITLQAPDTVIADSVYVLSSKRLYNLPRPDIQAMLATLLRFPHFKVRYRRALLLALELYASTNLDFGDTFIVASMHQAASKVLYSFDEGFDKLPQISRVEP